MISTPERGHFSGRRAATIAAAAIGALLVWLIADPLADLDLTIGSGASSRQIGPGSVAGVALLAGLAATGLAALLTRTGSNARRTWQIIALAVLALSLTGPLGADTSSAQSSGAAVKGALIAMHLVVGATLILGIGSTVPLERTGQKQTADQTPERQQPR